jgi:hypothetical protein
VNARLAPRARLVLAVALLLAAVWLAPWLEASMARHMLVQLPLLVAAGWCAAATLAARWPIARIDDYGITGLSALLFVSAYWMVPRALELSLSVPLAEAAKFASLLALGLVLPGSLARCPWVVQLFFLGNFGAMMAIAGVQYQNLPERLCNAYLLDDQALTGMGLVIGAIVISLAWCARIAPALSATPTHPDSHELPNTEHGLDLHPRP